MNFDPGSVQGDVPESVFSQLARKWGLRLASQDLGKEPPFPEFTREQWDRLELWLEWRFCQLSDPAETAPQKQLVERAHFDAANVIRKKRPKEGSNGIVGKPEVAST